MQTSAIRVEVIRFSLLVTLTVALLSVAIRLASHNDSHSTLRPGGLPSGSGAPSSSSTTTPSSAPTTAAPSVPAPSPSATTSFVPRTPGGSGGGSGGSAGQPVLPVTGDDALRLVAMSLVLIGGGALTVRAARR